MNVEQLKIRDVYLPKFNAMLLDYPRSVSAALTVGATSCNPGEQYKLHKAWLLRSSLGASLYVDEAQPIELYRRWVDLAEAVSQLLGPWSLECGVPAAAIHPRTEASFFIAFIAMAKDLPCKTRIERGFVEFVQVPTIPEPRYSFLGMSLVKDNPEYEHAPWAASYVPDLIGTTICFLHELIRTRETVVPENDLRAEALSAMVASSLAGLVQAAVSVSSVDRANEVMLSMMANNREYDEWTADQWVGYLKVTKKTVLDTEAWIGRMARRLENRNKRRVG